MSDHLKGRVEWFLENLDFQLEDLALEASGFVCDIYMDSSDVTDAVLGMMAFDDPGVGFEVEHFHKKRTLVHCLAASGWLGKIHMLPPHQAEFLNLLNIYFGDSSQGRLETLATTFMKTVGVQGSIDVGALRTMSKEKLAEFVNQQAGSAEKFFKAVECINGNWQTRLWAWRDKKVLELERGEYDYTSLIHSENFKRLKKAFDNRRDKPMSNFADAMSVCILVSLFESFKNDKTKRVPRFFVSRKLFPEAMKEAGIYTQLQCEDSKRGRLSVLRKEDYFVFKSMFRPPSTIQAGDRGYMAEFTKPENLRRIRDRVAELLEAQEPLTEELINQVDVAGKALSAVIEDFEKLGFLQNVWLRYAALTDVQGAARRLVDAARELQESAKFWKGVEQAVNETRDALKRNVTEYKAIRSLWTELKGKADHLRVHLGGTMSEGFDIFWQLGLLRFAFPESAEERINNVLKALLGGGEGERNARASIIAAYQTRQSEPEKMLEDLALAAAGLWVTKMYVELVKLFERMRGLAHPSLKIVYAAALFRLKMKTDLGRKLIAELERQYKSSQDERDRGDLAVGIAYLNFHLAESLGYKAPWREESGPSAVVTSEDIQRSIKNAITYAKSACGALRTGNIKKKVYAVNQYLYYMVEGGGDELLPEMNRAAVELMEYKRPNRELWQYRFDDTLARYYHRLARSEESETKRDEFMRIAIRRSEEAWKEALGDEEVEMNVDRIRAELGVIGFRKA